MTDFLRRHNEVGIFTHGRLTFQARQRPWTPHEKQVGKQYIDDALNRAWIRPSTSSITSDTLFVPKKNGHVRFCINYVRLNKHVDKVVYAPVNHTATRHDIARHTWKAKIDLKDAFYHIQLDERDKWKTAFATPYGVYEYNVLPFGLCTAPGHFQRYIEQVLTGILGDNVVVYIDDILIHTDSLHQCAKILQQTRHRLNQHHIQWNDDKSHGPRKETEFCGHIYRPGTFQAVSKADTIESWPTPRNATDLKQFLGLTNYLRDEVTMMAHIARPLYQQTGAAFTWGTAQEAAFRHVKASIRNRITTNAHIPTEACTLITDASDFAIGAFMQQNGKTTGIISRQLTAAERNYDASDRELLATVWALEKWIWLVEAAPIIYVKTDNAINVAEIRAKPGNGRRARWMAELSKYKIDWSHIPGMENPADIPSRRPDYKYRRSARLRKGGR